MSIQRPLMMSVCEWGDFPIIIASIWSPQSWHCGDDRDGLIIIRMSDWVFLEQLRELNDFRLHAGTWWLYMNYSTNIGSISAIWASAKTSGKTRMRRLCWKPKAKEQERKVWHHVTDVLCWGLVQMIKCNEAETKLTAICFHGGTINLLFNISLPLPYIW